MKKKFVIFLSSILLAISSLLVPVFNRDKMSAKAEATSDTTSYVSVGELWDSTNNVINTDNFLTMLKYTTGSDNISYGKLANTAYESLSAKEIKSLSHSGKAAGKNIVVTLGGLTWDVVYLSTDVNGEPIVTLWLSNSQQELWKTGSYYTGPYNSFDPNGQIRSQWSVWQANSLAATDQIPSNMYSTSYIHTVTLNNGGSYLSAYETLNSVSQNSNSAFALYTMEEFGLTDYLTTPAEVGWQLNQSAKTVLGVPNDFPNEASGELSVESWYSSTFDYTNKNGYFSWANDYLWLPSITEIGDAAEKGIWKVSDDQRKHVNGTSTSMESQAFLRTARASDITSVRVLMPTGASGDANYWTSYKRSLRPALHINIKKVYDYINETKSTDYSVIYLDPVYGDDSYSGDFLTPIKTIKLAEKMVEENGKVVLLNTLTILEDTVLGSYKNYTLQRYYGGDGDSFKGILIQAGKFVSNGSADNIHVNLSLQKITIDGNSRKNGTITNARTNWGTFAGSNQGLNGDGSLIMAANAKIIVGEDSCLRDNYLARGATMTNGAGIYLNNDSTALVAGGTFDNLCAYDYGGAFYNHTYGQIVIDNGTFINNSVQITGGVAYFAHATGTSIVINDGIFGYAYDADDDGTLAQSEIHGNC